jgi:chromosome segregation ATPase
MVEEAAGVRMYEQKKQSAVRIIEKKDARREEIHKVRTHFPVCAFPSFLLFCKFIQLIEEDILPRVEKLKEDRDRYVEFQRIDNQIETLEKKYTAYEYYTNTLNITTLENTSRLKRQEHEICVNNTYELRKQLEHNELELVDMEKEKSSVGVAVALGVLLAGLRVLVSFQAMSDEKKALESNLEQCLKEQANADSLRDDQEHAKREKTLELEKRNKAVVQVCSSISTASRH